MGSWGKFWYTYYLSIFNLKTPAGSGKVPVGFPIALTAEEGDDISNLTAPDTSAIPPQKTSEIEAPVTPQAGILFHKTLI